MIGGQYGEDAIILKLFRDAIEDALPGFVVDVGAADGIDNSNTHCLLTRGWGGLLIEPDPEQFRELELNWGANPRVQLVPQAVGKQRPEPIPFYCGRQVSTASEDWKRRCEAVHGIQYRTIQVSPMPLGDLLKKWSAPQHIDMLSVDCEGMDLEVLQTMDWDNYRVGVVVVEDKGGPVDTLLSRQGFILRHNTRGNYIYVNDTNL